MDVNKLIKSINKPKQLAAKTFLSLIEEEVNKALGFPLLEREEVEEQSETKKFSAAKFYKTALKSFKAPTEQAGKLGTAERRNFQKYISNNISGNTLAEKITSINAIVDGGVEENPKVSEIMASLGAVKMLQQTLDDFNESTAGFLFEAFLSGLLKGKQVTERVGGTLPIEDVMFFVDPKTGQGGQPVSLKLLSPQTKVEGSLENLLGFFMRPEVAAVAEEKGIEYIVATKTKKNELDMYSFNIKPSTFFYWVSEKHFSLKRYQKEEQLQEATESATTPEQINYNKEQWEAFFLKRAPMFGLDPQAVDFNYDWKNQSFYWKVAPFAPRSGGLAPKTAEIVLSPEGQKAFADWARSELAEEDFIELAVSPELQEAFEAGDVQSAIQIAKIGNDRQRSYMRSIVGAGETFRESEIHITRWWAANVKGEHVYGDTAAQINALAQAGDAESIVKWAQTLMDLLVSTQFHINQNRVRSEGTLYGTIDVNKRKIYRSLQKYSILLERLVAPLYEEMDNLTNQINGYYLQNRPGEAFKAASTAQRLVAHTSQLSREASGTQGESF